MIENGGTGSTTANTAINALLPIQLGRAGEYLTTNGISVAWDFPVADQAGQGGKYLTTDGVTTAWEAPLPDQTGNTGDYLMTNGTTTEWSTPIPDQSGNTGLFLSTNGTNTVWLPAVQVGNTNIFTRNQSVQTKSLTDAAVVTIDASQSNNFELQATQLVGATREIADPTNATSGMEINLWVYQSSVGGENITWGTAFKFPGGVPYTSTLTADAVDFYKINYSSTKNIWLVTQQANVS